MRLRHTRKTALHFLLIATIVSFMTSIPARGETGPLPGTETEPRPENMTEAASDSFTVLKYPDTLALPIAEEQFGTKVADPYRWLEDDVRVNPDVADWVKQQNEVTDGYLAKLPGRDVLAKRMEKLFDYERFGLPQKAGGRYFYMRNDGLQKQSQLYTRSKLSAKGSILIDPNTWSQDGTVALDGWVPSENGERLVYTQQDGGSDWRTVRILDVKSGNPLDDKIEWVKFSNIAWIGNDAFLYSRFPEPAQGAQFQSLNKNHSVYYHKVGTPQSEDRLVYATPDQPKLNHIAEVTHDGKWIIITSSSGTDEKYEITGMNIGKNSWAPVRIVEGFDYEWNLVEGIGDTLWFVTNKDAPRLKVVKTDLANPQRRRTGCPTNPESSTCIKTEYTFADVVAEREATLARAQIVGERLILSYMQDAKSVAEMTTLDGQRISRINLNSIGTASGFSGRPGDPETFYAFSSFNQPGAIYRFDSVTGQSSVFEKPELIFDPDDIVIDQRFYTSKDGTEIPVFVVYKKGLDLASGAPTLLYGYGGFNVSLTPSFSATRMAWIQSGGVYAQASLRGGGEYGKAWHDGGRLLNKQNVFDDFVAAGEYLIAEGIAGKGQLAIEGRSNGGLLVGASINQRPDLFAAGHAAVGVMDMLRFDRFTAGRYWVDDYGYPDREADFKNLLSYSPYHNVKGGTDYPAIIVSTADTDDRVVPGHSFKYTAALQAANTGDAPKIIRIETRAGHGSGKPTDKVIEEYSDIYAFLAHHTGLEIISGK